MTNTNSYLERLFCYETQKCICHRNYSAFYQAYLFITLIGCAIIYIFFSIHTNLAFHN